MKIALIIVAAVVLAVGGYFAYTYFALGNDAAGVPNDPASAGKLDINIVCESALSYMTFPDDASAQQFVAECKAGEHPEVVEHYKQQQGYGDGAAI